MLRVGVIGYGYWGPNLARNFSDNQDCRLVAVCDGNPARLQMAERRYPGIFATSDANELINHTNVDAVAIATPVNGQPTIMWFYPSADRCDAARQIAVDEGRIPDLNDLK